MFEQRMNVALISEHASPIAHCGGVDAGGQNVYVHHVARRLAEAGHRVDVMTRADRVGLPAVVDVRPGYRVLHIGAGPARFVAKERLLEHMPEFARAAARQVSGGAGYDVVHANFFMSGWVGLELKAAFGIPLVVTFHALGLVRQRHQGSSDAFPPERIAIERRLVAQADRLIAECPQDAADLASLYGARRERMSLVPCGVDAQEFAPRSRAAARRELGLDDGDFVVLQLGRIVPRKGVDDVLRAAALLDDRRSVVVLVVGGDHRDPALDGSEEMARLHALAAELGIADRVRFVGQRQRAELATFYAACDVFATTPWYEPFGITPLEAMACARPVVGSDVGGIRHSVVDGVTGRLVPPRDPRALAAGLAELRGDPRRAEAMGFAGVRRVRSMFTWERVAAGLAGAYATVAAGRPPAPVEPPRYALARPRRAAHDRLPA